MVFSFLWKQHLMVRGRKRKLLPHFQSGVGKQSLCAWAHSPPPHCQVFTMATSFQTRGTEHISIWCWEAQREWEWGPATPPLPGQGPGLALTQAYSHLVHFPHLGLMRVITRTKGKKVAVWNLACSSSVGPLEAAGLGGCSWCLTAETPQTCSMRDLQPWVQQDTKCF